MCKVHNVGLRCIKDYINPARRDSSIFQKIRLHLREATVRTLEAGHALADEVMDVALLHRCRQVQARQHRRRLFTDEKKR